MKRVAIRAAATVWALAALLGVSSSAAAQPLGAAARGDESPYHLTWLTDGLLSAAAVAGVGVAAAVRGEAATLTMGQSQQLTPLSVNWFDRSATSRYSSRSSAMSGHMGTVLMLAPLALMADADVRRSWSAVGVMYVQTTLIAGSLAKIAKETVHRYRPYVFNPDLSYAEKTKKDPGGAFFSLAATSAFAHATLLATVFGDHHPDSRMKPYVWIGSLATATAVGYLRYDAGLHYPSDVIVGALVGGSVAYLVPRLHRRSARRVAIVPAVAGDRVGVLVSIDRSRPW